MNLREIFSGLPLAVARMSQRWSSLFAGSRQPHFPTQARPREGIQEMFQESPVQDRTAEVAIAIIDNPVPVIADEGVGAMVATPDPDREALQLKISSLQARIVDLSARHTQMEQLLQRFEYSQYQALGELLTENLRLRHEYLSLKARHSGSAEDMEAEREAAAEFEAYRKSGEKEKALPSLDELEEDELKRLYRAAAMRCHPDRVADRDKTRAHDLFLRIQTAYRQNDLDGLRLIQRQLAAEGSFDEEAFPATDNGRLLQLICDLEGRAADLILAIQTMQLDGGYRKAARTADWEDYFASVRELLAAECFNLKEQIRAFSKA